jgi:hypothetical protein
MSRIMMTPKTKRPSAAELDAEYDALMREIEADEDAAGLKDERDAFYQSYQDAVDDCRGRYRYSR